MVPAGICLTGYGLGYAPRHARIGILSHGHMDEMFLSHKKGVVGMGMRSGKGKEGRGMV